MAGKGALQEAIEEAASIASVVPESMQDAAFHRALDEILGATPTPDGDDKRQTSRRRGGATARARKQGSNSQSAGPGDALSKINRTEHPQVDGTMSVLDRALSVLLIAKDLGVDGLSAPKIAEILTDKFRIKTYRQHVNEQLDSASRLVDREKTGRSVTYRIMAPGEEHLVSDSKGTKPDPPTGRKRKPRSGRGNKKAKADPGTGKAPSPRSKGRSRSSSRPGPKAAVQNLIDARFFTEARTLGDIQDRLATKVGHRYKATDLSPALGRLLRDHKLDRDRNESGQFEYKQP